MGMQDRDYYWEDRKRREKKFEKKGSYHQPNEFRNTGIRKNNKTHEDRGSRWRWIRARKIDGYSFLSGFILSFLLISFSVNLVPGFIDFLSKPARGILQFFGMDVW